MARLFALAVAAALVACGEAEAPPEPPPTPEPVVEPEPEPEPVEPEPEPIGPSTHDVLFLVVHEAPLLPSEERLLGVLEARLGRRRDVERRDATDEEAELADRILDGSAADRAGITGFPETFGRASQVLVMRTAPPRTRPDGDFVSRGFTGLLLLGPPELEPVYEQRIDLDSAWRLTDDQWSSWLSGLFREAAGS